MKTKVYNQRAEVVGDISLTKNIFNVKSNDILVHQVVVAQMGNERQVLAHTKTRSEVRSGGRKPWRQKGTGRARVGSNRSPIWIGGGVTFGPRSEKNYKKNINKKMKQKAMFIAISDRVRNESLVILDEIKIEEYKTKVFNEIVSSVENKIIKNDKNKRSILVINDKKDEKIKYSGKNLEGVKIINIDNINILDLLKYRNLIITKTAVENLEKRYK